MELNNSSLAEVCLDNYYFPIKVVSKHNSEGQDTVSKIRVKAQIATEHENIFCQKILGIINDTNSYIGLNQLSANILEYFNVIESPSAVINYKYPYFVKRKFANSKEYFTAKYVCVYTFEKKSLLKIGKKFKVEVPVYGLIDYNKSNLKIPQKISVEIDGLDTIFAEDIIEVVEDVLINSTQKYFSIEENGGEENVSIILLESIRNKLFNKYNFYSSAIEVTSRNMQCSYSSNILRKEEEMAQVSFYDGEYIFI